MVRPARVRARGAASLLLAAAMLDTASAALKPACTGADGSWISRAGAPIDCLNISYAAEPACAAMVHVAGLFPLSPPHFRDESEFYKATHDLCHEGTQALRAAQTAERDVNCVDDCPVEHGLLSFADAVFTYDAGTTADDCVLDGVVKNCCETRTPVCREYCLHMHANDDQSDPGLALKLADDYMNTPWTLYASIDLFIGGLTSDVSEALNHLLQHALVPQISYGATSDTLGGAEGEEDFPTFLRTVPSDALLVNGVVALTEYAEWRMMSILAVDKEFGRAVAENLYTQLNNLDNKVAVPAHKLFTVDNVAEHLLFIRDKTESRVIFLHCTSMDALHVLKIASDLDMLGDGWAWVGSEWAQDVIIDEITVGDDEFDMFEDEGEKTAFLEELSGIVAFRATNDNLNANIKGAIDFEVLAKTGSDQRRFNDVRSQEFQCDKLVGTTHVSQYAYFAYDAMLLGATAIHRSLAKGNLAKEFDKTMVEINDMEGATTVPNAATGSIALDQYGDRIMAYDMVNFVAGEGEGEFEWKVVGNYVPCEDPGAAEMCTADQEEEGWGMFLYGNNQDHPQYDIDLAIRWPGGSTQTPSDRTMGHLSMQALYLFFFLTFIIFSICAGNFLHAHEFYVLPESGATILFGLLLGSVLKLVSHMWHMEGELAAMTEFDTDLFSLLLLPIIIFAAGFNLRKKDLFSNLPPICLTAYFGTTISTIMIGMGCYWFGSKGYFEFGSMSIPESLTYGALISAVDPVATLAVFGALGVETDLNMRVFGESVINDGVSIVLFRVFGQYISEEFTMASAADGVRRFFQIQILSIIVGILAALFLAFVMKYARLHAHTLECAIVLIGSYVAYAGAETIGASGIIASLVCGIAMNHWTYHNFTYDGEVLTRRTVKMFSLLADTVIFFQVGQNIVVHTSQSATGQDWSFIGITIGLCLVSRAFNIMPLLSLYNICAAEDKKVPFKHMLVMWWAGLRGAIAFALALHFPSQNVHVVISTCMWVILFTVFILGGTCVSFLELMDVKFGVESNDVQDFKKSKQLGAMKNPLQKFDRKVLLPLVTWRFETDGNDTYIENPEEARAYRKGIPWEPAEH